MTLRAYTYQDDPEGQQLAVIYHHNAKDAKKLGVSRIGYEGEYTDVTCSRLPEADQFAEKTDEPRIESDDRTLRKLGWRYDGEPTCCSCGLAPMGLDEFSVCPECHSCPECGHDDDCLELLGTGR